MSQRQPVGIDLGTTYSAVATLDANGRTVMVRNAEGEVLTPSVVLFDGTEIVVGKFAKRAVGSQADRVAECVKREMGQPVFSRSIGGQFLPPEVIQACILRKLRRDAGPALGDAGVVITVPAYFDEPRRKATADAAELAGLDLLDTVNEPTAAALAFGEQMGYLTASGEFRDPMNVLVYDLGGGTFDATVIKLAKGEIRTLATDGDVELGGRDFDQRLAQHVATHFQQLSGIDLKADPAAWNQLMAQVEQTKHTLSTREKAVIHVEHSGRSSEMTVTRDEFRQMNEDLLDRSAFTLRQVISAAGLTFDKINRVLLVGGSTRMPMVSAMLKQLTGITPDLSINPDEAVARGAAIFAGYLLARQQRAAGARPSFKVTDVNSHSLGIQGLDPSTKLRENVIVIPRNTPLPAVAKRQFATQSAGQRSIVVQVLEGESSLANLCSKIGRSVLRDLPTALPAGWPVEISFEYAANGRLNIQASIPGTERSLTIELERERGLTGERLHCWKQLFHQAPGVSKEPDAEALLAEALKLAGPLGVPLPTASPVASAPGPPGAYGTAPMPGSAEGNLLRPMAMGPLAAGSPPMGAVAAGSPAPHGASPIILPGVARGIRPGDNPPSLAVTTEQPRAAGAAPATSATPKASATTASPHSAGPARLSHADRWADEAVEAAPTPEQLLRRRRIRKLMNVVGHLVASTGGLVLGYIILCRLRPDADFLHLFSK